MSDIKYKTGHVGLNVTNLSSSKSFYEKIFGFDTIAESPRGDKRFAFLGYGSEILLTLWQQSGGTFGARNPGLHHLSFSVPTLEDVENAEAALKYLGAKFEYEGVVPHREGAASGGIFFEDPDGIRLEIYTAGVPSETDAPHGEAPTCGFF
jgi:catechol 2,3-dioxygenase-like lactoylglutathione lyase family enzyme